MASETPKRVMDEISKCFLCSSPSAAEERVFIFGNSIHNFVEVSFGGALRDIPKDGCEGD